MGQAPEPPTEAGGLENDSSLRTLIRQLSQRGFGTTAWAATLRQMLRFYTDPELRETVSGELLTSVENAIVDALNRDAEATRPILEEAGFPLGEDVETWQQAYNELLDAVDAGLGGGSGLIGSIRETVSELVDQETIQTRTEDVETALTEAETAIRRETRYVELPTAEKLLDDFDNVMIEHADTLWRAGDIDRRTRDWLVQNPGYFWSGFVAEQYRRIREGEEPFRVVGVTGPQVKLGSRPGEAVAQEVTTLTNQVDVGTLTVEDIVERTIERLTAQAGTQDGGAVATDLQQSITEEVTSLFKQFNMATQKTEAIRALTLLTVEEVIARPQLDRVFAYSPTDFITERFTPTELMNIAAAVPGQQAAARQAPFGTVPSAPRRLA